MALATEADVEAAFGRPPGRDVTTLLEEASDLVLGYLRWPPELLLDATTVPPAVTRVVASMVAAALNRPAGMASIAPGDQLTAGPYTASTSADGAGGVWLTNALKQRLRPYRRALVPVRLQSELYEDEEEAPGS